MTIEEQVAFVVRMVEARRAEGEGRMKVTIDGSAGFCWGVVRTIDIAEEEMKSGGALYSLGPVIHNPMEIERLREKGLETVTHADLAVAARERGC